MKKLFYPKSVAIFGVSGRHSTVAANILENLNRWKYQGDIFLVNPAGGEYEGHKIYRSVTEIDDPIDMAVVLTKAKNIAEIMEHCQKKDIRAVCILSGGFGELDENGMSLGRELKRKATQHGIDVIGPNCLGIVNTQNGLCTPFIPFDRGKKGPVGIISQSGSLSASLVLQLSDESLGFSKLASIGNKLMLDEVDFLRFYCEDAKTEVILIYLESCSRGREFMLEASKSGKPIIMYKANTTEAGSRMSWSHTAALRGNHQTFLSGMKQAGVIVSENFNRMGIMAKSFLGPRMKGKRVAVISGAGGQLVIAADCAEENGFTLPRPGSQVINKVKPNIRSGVINLSNPMDLGDTLGHFVVAEATEAFMAQPDIEGAVVLSVKHPYKPFKNDIWAGFTSYVFDRYEPYPKIYGKPLLQCVNTNLELLRELKQSVSYPVFDNVREAFQVLRLMSEFHKCKKFRNKDSGLKENSGIRKGMDLIDCFEILENEKLPLPPWLPSRGLEDTIYAGERLGYPVVLKFSSSIVSHKTEFNAVRTDIESEDEMKLSYMEMIDRLCSKRIDPKEGRFLVQKQICPPTIEMFIGTFKDTCFGQTISVGAGGILVEMFHDVATRICPVSADEVDAMLSELKANRLLKGFRNTAKVDRAALVELIHRVSSFAFANPKISEMDLNPVLVTGGGAFVVDCRMRVS